ncbi:MAG TPA: 3-methyladenine DNA glycosylase [Actinomycetes bacterium]|nr:3-methyladenine DNA glycosylase [Actinomycetes bacterium]
MGLSDTHIALRVGVVETTVLAEAEWTARRAAHEQRVDRWIEPHLRRRRRGQRHPVEDFLFDYYSYRPAQLRRWHPGPGVLLTGPAAAEYLRFPGYRQLPAGVGLDPGALAGRRADSARWISRLLSHTADRPAQLGCFGLHEWAMVYRAPADQVRHSAQPLRFDPGQIAEIVEQQRLACTHFDAYRFFTDPARLRNTVAPTRPDQLELEQPGCLHANMDLYKWAYKLAPLVDSELIADAFALAWEIRELDMRASPYDLSALGYQPVRIETAHGRAEYARGQRAFADRAAELRQRLLTAIDRVFVPVSH